MYHYEYAPSQWKLSGRESKTYADSIALKKLLSKPSLINQDNMKTTKGFLAFILSMFITYSLAQMV